MKCSNIIKLDDLSSNILRNYWSNIIKRTHVEYCNIRCIIVRYYRWTVRDMNLKGFYNILQTFLAHLWNKEWIFGFQQKQCCHEQDACLSHTWTSSFIYPEGQFRKDGWFSLEDHTKHSCHHHGQTVATSAWDFGDKSAKKTTR